MKYIAINTAAPIIEIAVVFDEKHDFFKLEKTMTAEQLLPKLDEMLETIGLALGDFDNFVCVVGPGSFTGIRIGVNTVRAFAYALEKNAYGVTYNREMTYSISDKCITFVDGGNGVCYVEAFDGDKTTYGPECIYKKDASKLIAQYGCKAIADFEMDGCDFFAPSFEALRKAAEYAIQNKTGTDPLYIRKPQPERTGNDI